jgi:hypothetical protein
MPLATALMPRSRLIVAGSGILLLSGRHGVQPLVAGVLRVCLFTALLLV